MAELADSGPNEGVIDFIEDNQNWFFDKFLTIPRMQRVHDEKVEGEQLVKALNKPFAASKKRRIDIIAEYNKRRMSF